MRVRTFHGVPDSPDGRRHGKPSDIAILGAPIDTGAGDRPGARFGPDAIRCAPYLVGEIHPLTWDTEVFKYLTVVDAGDSPVSVGSHIDSIEGLRRKARQVVANTSCLLTLGGDNSVVLPALEAVVGKHGPVTLLHFDAHTDTWGHDTARLTHATVLRRAVERNLIRRGHHIGVRGFGPPAEILRWGTAHCLTCWTMEDIDELGMDEIIHNMLREVSGPAYLSVDIDVLDPAYAPGTGTPEPGGLTSRELLKAVRVLARNLNLVGYDIVEVSPPYDHGDITAIVANRCVMELLAATAHRSRAAD
ncbi:MAG: agmatinase [Actinomycetota bacterium]|nr:agmatinase [Actinomycetota bacterium]